MVLKVRLSRLQRKRGRLRCHHYRARHVAHASQASLRCAAFVSFLGEVCRSELFESREKQVWRDPGATQHLCVGPVVVHQEERLIEEGVPV